MKTLKPHIVTNDEWTTAMRSAWSNEDPIGRVAVLLTANELSPHFRHPVQFTGKLKDLRSATELAQQACAALTRHVELQEHIVGIDIRRAFMAAVRLVWMVDKRTSAAREEDDHV